MASTGCGTRISRDAWRFAWLKAAYGDALEIVDAKSPDGLREMPDASFDQLYGQLYDQLCDQLRVQLRDQLSGQLYDQLYGQLDAQLYVQLYVQLRDQLLACRLEPLEAK